MRAPPPSQHRIDYEAGAALTVIADNRGVTAIEYTLIVALIALVIVVLIQSIGDFVSIPFETIASKL